MSVSPLPALDDDNRFFWTSGRDGRLRFLRCRACRRYFHPPAPRCPRCLGPDVAPEAVSGRGVVESFTFLPAPPDGGDDGRRVVAWIGFPEQDDLRLTAALVGVPVDRAAISLPVHVAFEVHGEVHLPVFVPADDPGGAS